jgi:hypothetical protein
MNDRKVNSEVLGVLTVLGDEYTSLIPEDIMEYFEANSDSEEIPIIDATKSIQEQNISKDARILLTMLKLNYWCKTQEEKDELIKLLDDNEKELNNKYAHGYKDFFKENEIPSDSTHDNNSTATELIDVKEKNFVQKLFEKIKRLFARKKE